VVCPKLGGVYDTRERKKQLSSQKKRRREESWSIEGGYYVKCNPTIVHSFKTENFNPDFFGQIVPPKSRE